MIYIAHRINTIEQLLKTSADLGVEIDIRSQGNTLYLSHDPFVLGENFEDWLKYFHHRILILNVKEDGLEKKIVSCLKKFEITDYFFLDQSLPALVQFANNGFSQTAVRLSEYEPIEIALNIPGSVKWIWADCFTKYSIDLEASNILHDRGFKICLVSPELQGRTDPELISEVAHAIKKNQIIADAVCSKRPDIWRNIFE
jgi:hypothetical protein